MIEIIKILVVIVLGLIGVFISKWSGKKDSSGGLTGISILTLFISLWIYVIVLFNH
ncbi:hypothetical protein 65p188 [Aeromonas phage 65]|uniref:Uncharacterized protein n=1 Tax=Aeromonas phage 65 TaxID=2919549 RepID=E5DS22_9CAUD|nr:hypothetical protein ST65p188 [Aeromonas phage 65]ADQ53196.1 hypothetical protein 65p188 [Aeromonas phage 65]